MGIIMRGDTDFNVERSTWVAAGAVVAIGALFGVGFVGGTLFELAQPLMIDAGWRARGLGLMVALGVASGSGLAGWRFNLLRAQAQLSWAFRGCAVGAAMGLMVATTSWSMVLAVAGVAGFSLGWMAVVVLALLRPTVGTVGLGGILGLGVGLAGGIDWIFAELAVSARSETIITAFLVATASLAAPFLQPQEPSVSPESEYRAAGALRWLIMLLGVVGLAAMEFHGASTAGALLGGCAAVATGLALDRGWRVVLPVIGLALVVLGRFWGGATEAALAGGVVLALCYAARGGRSRSIATVSGVVGGLGFGLGSIWSGTGPPLPASLLAGTAVVIALFAAWDELARRGAAARVNAKA